jgi:hypothetical protein
MRLKLRYTSKLVHSHSVARIARKRRNEALQDRESSHLRSNEAAIIPPLEWPSNGRNTPFMDKTVLQFSTVATSRSFIASIESASGIRGPFGI